jgi:5-aminolevulinate synthase
VSRGRCRSEAEYWRDEPPLIELKRELADLHRKEAALVFTSGYVSNLTGIATIAKLIPNCVILSGELNHN